MFSTVPTSEVAAVKALFGEIPITGHLPVRIPGFAKLGDGIQLGARSQYTRRTYQFMIEITWLGHATFQLRLESGEVFLLDPWTDGNPAYPKSHTFDRVDAILYPHGHFDHIHDAFPWRRSSRQRWWRSSRRRSGWNRKACKHQPHEQGRLADGGPVKVTMVHAVHSCGIMDGDHIIYGGEAVGMCCACPTTAPYFAGDTNVFTDMELIRELIPPGTGLSAHRRSIHHESTGSLDGGEAPQREGHHPDALRHLPAAHRHAGATIDATQERHAPTRRCGR